MRSEIESHVKFLEKELKNVQETIQIPELHDEVRSFYEGVEAVFISEIVFLERVLHDDIRKQSK